MLVNRTEIMILIYLFSWESPRTVSRWWVKLFRSQKYKSYFSYKNTSEIFDKPCTDHWYFILPFFPLEMFSILKCLCREKLLKQRLVVKIISIPIILQKELKLKNDSAKKCVRKTECYYTHKVNYRLHFLLSVSFKRADDLCRRPIVEAPSICCQRLRFEKCTWYSLLVINSCNSRSMSLRVNYNY